MKKGQLLLQITSFHKKIQLLHGMLTGQTAKTGPFYVTWDIIGRCNLQWIGCAFHTPLKPHNPPAPDFPLDTFRRVCRELRGLDTHTLVIQGAGEPLLHPDLCPMIRTAKANRLAVVILTNGTLLGRDMCRKLLDSQADHLEVSLWASTPAEFERNYPGNQEATFQKIIKGLLTLADVKERRGSNIPKVIIRYIINRNNFKEMDRAVDLAVETRCSGVIFSVMHNFSGEVGDLMLGGDEISVVEENLIQIEKRMNRLSLIHNIPDVRLRYRIGENVLRKLPCYIAWYSARIRYNGHVAPCARCASENDFGNVHEQTFEKIWNGENSRAFRQHTMKRNATPDIMAKCDCRYCCFVCDNRRIHRIFRFFRPLAGSV